MPPRSNVSGTRPPKYPPRKAAATEGGVIQAAMRQSTRPARACATPPVSADAALTAMFVPAAVAALPDARITAGRRRLPSTSPTAPPSTPAPNDAAAASARRQASRGAPRRSPRPGRG